MAEEKICPHGNKMISGHIYDSQAQKLEFINKGTYRILRCCGEPMKRIVVKAIHNRDKDGNQKAVLMTIAECPCCGKEILDAKTGPAKIFISWLSEKLGKKNK